MSSAVHAGVAEILYVEDNPGDAQLLATAFAHRADARLQVVENGVQLYEYLGHHRGWAHAPDPDLIIVDLNLPVISGRDILREISSDAKWRHLPIVVLSCSLRDADVADCYRNGALRYLLKPSHWDDFPKLADEIMAILSAYPNPY
jgi:CheY-like chemotaxis protein